MFPPAEGHGSHSLRVPQDLSAVEADIPAPLPAVQRPVAPHIGKEAVAVFIYAEFRLVVIHPPGVDIYILPEDLPRAGRLKEAFPAEASVLRRPGGPAVRNRVLMQGAFPDRGHVLVQFRAAGFAESPVGIHPAVVVHQDAWIKTQFGLHRIGKRPPRRLRPGDHNPGSLAVRGVHIPGIAFLHHIRCVKDTLILRPVAGAVAVPVRQVRHRGGPDHIVLPAVFCPFRIVRSVDVYPRLPVKGKDARFPVRHMLPQRHIRICAFDKSLLTHMIVSSLQVHLQHIGFGAGSQ